MISQEEQMTKLREALSKIVYPPPPNMQNIFIYETLWEHVKRIIKRKK